MKPRFLEIRPQTLKKLLNLKKTAEIDGEYRIAKRIHSVILNYEKKTSGEIAEILKAPRSKVSQWLKNYEVFGFDGILEGCRCGRPSSLTVEEKIQLGDIIDSGPVAYGYTGGVWTSPMIAKFIIDEFNVEYHPRHVLRIIDDLGFSHQRPKRVLAKADPIKQNKWRKYTYPRIKKKHEQKMQH
ncbi:MAG: winged helix-turn-helix domain-containing protein [Oligoflexia bacterium]|nr:winged helix-turn-helix domain-containing protein [Oligoflexia bacterium]